MNQDNGRYLTYSGVPIVITTVRNQNRKHKKKRINKKWAKIYGFSEYNYQKNGEVMAIDGKIYMNRKTYNELNILFIIP